MKRKLVIGVLALLLLSPQLDARENLREVFKNNKAVIYTINIRNFGAVDKNHDSIIDEDEGDIKGTFLNAKDKLQSLKNEGINTIYVLPITPSGKLKALGTAGSLYAMDSFNTINPQLDDNKNDMPAIDEAKEFIKTAHSLDLNVILDLPSCGSYDFSLRKPNWFVLDKKQEAIIPADWTDVRLFKIYDKDGKTLYKDTLNNFKSFVDMAQEIGFDGIRADVAAIKPKEFWKEIINYARSKNENFLFLAEASLEWGNPAPLAVSKYTSIDELLEAGFDCYYGSWSDFKNIKSKNEFDRKIKNNLKNLKKNKGKSIMASFATHDQQAPILRGKNYWDMVLWLTTTLPVNSYFLDGFSQGDDFTYSYENKKAKNSQTDDEYYFVHSGMFDIFNLTGPIRLKHSELKKKYLKAISFKERNLDLINGGTFKILDTKNEKVFAYSITDKDRELIVVGSLDENQNQDVNLKSKYLRKDYLFSLINTKRQPKIEKSLIKTTLEPLEIQVYMVSLAKTRAM